MKGSTQPGGFIVTIANAGKTTHKRVEGDLLTVGRAPDCQLILNDESLSRRHLSFRLLGDECYVEDHGSSNGTFKNGKALAKHKPTLIKPEDVVTLGRAPMRLSVAPEASSTAQDRTESTQTIVTSTNAKRLEQRLIATESIGPITNAPAPENMSQVMQEAQKRAALLMQNAEIEAERRAEEIHRQANAKKTEMDERFQRRMNEALRESEKVYQKAREDSVQILEAARNSATEIRAHADSFASDMRKQSEAECVRILDDAKEMARDLKEQRLLEADDLIKIKEDELLSATRDSMAKELASFEADLSKEASRRRGELKAELDERRATLEFESISLVESIAQLREEREQLLSEKHKELASRSELEVKVQTLQTELQNLHADTQFARTTFSQSETELKNSREAQAKLQSDNQTLERDLKSSRDTLGKLTEEIRDAGESLRKVRENSEKELLQMRVDFEDRKAKFAKDERAHFDNLSLQTTQNVRVLEKQMLEELNGKKSQMSREITLLVETFFKANPDAKGRDLKELQAEILAMFDRQLASVANNEGAKAKRASLVELKRRERWSTVAMGLVVGCLLTLGGIRVARNLDLNLSPMDRKVAAAQEAQKVDLEKRKFNPSQSFDYKASYVENVVYTRDFVATMSDDEFQKKFMKALSAYMLRTWKIDEDKTIQLIGISSSLVKILAEKRANIHPDFEAQGLEKMRQDELEATNRMKNLLGTQVRFEAFMKFEKEFYETYTRPK